MRHRFGLLCLLLASIAFAAGGCVVAGYYGGAYYNAYPGPGYYAPHRHHWR